MSTMKKISECNDGLHWFEPAKGEACIPDAGAVYISGGKVDTMEGYAVSISQLRGYGAPLTDAPSTVEPKCRDCDDTGIFYGNVAPCHCEAYKQPKVHSNPYKDQYPMTRAMVRPCKAGKPHIVWTGKRWVCSSQRFYQHVTSKQQAIHNANYNNAEVFARKLNRKGTLNESV